MSIFIARFFKTKKNDSSLHEICSSHLPKQPKKHQSFSLPQGDAAVYYFNAALDRNVIQKNNELIFCHGYGDDHLEERITSAFKLKNTIDLVNFPEAFCAIRLHQTGIDFASSAVGIDPLFYFEDDANIIVTNKHNLLGPWTKNASLRKEAFAWMIGRSHIGDFGTCWEEIKKTRPGTLYSFNQGLLQELNLDYSSIFDPIKDDDIQDHIYGISKYFQKILEANQSGCRFWLSGGKDSRAVAGMLSGSKFFKKMTFQTHGEKFSPDVMSAITVANELDIAAQHTVQRLSLTEPTIDLSKAIAQDILSDCSGGSLADFKSIPNSDFLIFGGHESGYKVQPNRLDLQNYLNSRKYWPDNQEILHKDMYESIYKKFRSELASLLQDAPQSRYPQVEALVYVIGTRVTGAHSNSHISRSEIHPFLDGRMVRLLFGVSDEALKNQMIHYIMMRQCPYAIEGLPFAADKWPDQTIEHAKKIQTPFRSEPQEPYKFMDYFPSQKKFGGYSWRLDLIEKTTPFIKSYINSHKNFFDFVDIKRLELLTSTETSTLNISDIYFRLGLLKACLTHYFSKNNLIYNFNNLELISQQIADLINQKENNKTTKDPIDAYKKKIDQYEEAIARIAERDRLNSADLEKSINHAAAKILVPSFKHDPHRISEELKKIGYRLLPKEGYFISTTKNIFKLSCHVMNTSQKPNSLLISIKNRPQKHHLDNMEWSEFGEFWFRYINEDYINVEINLGENGGDLWIAPWYNDHQIFISKASIS